MLQQCCRGNFYVLVVFTDFKLEIYIVVQLAYNFAKKQMLQIRENKRKRPFQA